MRVALIGAGLMGTGLARLLTRAGAAVSVFDTNADALAALRHQVGGTTALASLGEAARDADLVIEAASERLEIKQGIFAELAAAGGPAILATNSSVIPVGAITAMLGDADAARCVGTHFWNPPDVIPLVEVIQGPRTNLATVDAAMEMLAAAGKEPVHVRRDVVPGNRLQHALWREAIALVEEGVCSPEDVDHIVKRSFGMRLPVLGPLENADLVGLELTAQIHQVVLPTLSRATEASPELARRIGAGQTGVAAGKGFYDSWTADGVAQLRARLRTHLDAMLPGGSQLDPVSRAVSDHDRFAERL
ncbi:3-hydroxyacyl-CoA dehydrogenase family protein [Sphingomonas sp.]|jgi:3-hydroxybutyryl-CoA dehydrogenase|uniref:3-hydroxyacyl-CoA dehydrogenase family protein n=1 Tax=Sphingomonas sp. TaxID=28214 RepID=UPI002ED99848